ncbi:unnamed protein product [Polarella glacialis]|uniref:LAGLIDADG endonuclease n=1 Tax=Polarella glacialis TaxID=89957 RepID=A0A813E5Y0_POLGL|nr:unnamed protein product [Polarella glacialis]
MNAFGKQYKLPFRFVAKDLFSETALRHDLEYCAGFFDGDGCVTGVGRDGTCRLQIGQSASSCEALLLFARLFGGAVYVQRRGKGSAKPMVQWQLGGEACIKAAAALGCHPSVKQSQLQLAASWPKPPLRDTAVKHLRALKDATPKPEDVHCSWSYLAGFFDAEGCISVPAKQRSVVLQIGQKHKAALAAIQSFLGFEFPQYSSHLRSFKGMWHLSLEKTDFSRCVSTRMVSFGLRVKRESAKAALSLEDSNHAVVRAKLAGLSGNQSKSIRLDEEGCFRARAIAAAQTKLYYYSSVGRADLVGQLKLEITHMKERHARLNAEHRISNLRRQVRIMLRTGCVAE